jgi:hypothetical protein
VHFARQKNYVVDFRMLKFCLNQKMELLNIHRILKYNQSPFMKSFIDLNMSKRAMAANDFEFFL